MTAVHPRWRGEHRLAARRQSASTGSSPLARGTLRCARLIQSCLRFIPAGAGNTSLPLNESRSWPVHPRWRGEHRRLVSSERSPRGSSPLARGTPGPQSRLAFRVRFIPAGAGNTYKSRTFISSTPVHPRWCGIALTRPPNLIEVDQAISSDLTRPAPVPRCCNFKIRF